MSVPTRNGGELDAAMVRVQTGDAPAFDALFDGLWPILVAYARARLGSVPDAEDAAQSALVRLFEQAPNYEVGRPVVGWALCLAHFECLSVRKKRSRDGSRRDTLDEAAMASDERSPEELTMTGEHLHALGVALDGFSAEERAILLDEASRPDTERAQAAARKRKQRLRARLGDALKNLLWRTDP